MSAETEGEDMNGTSLSGSTKSRTHTHIRIHSVYAPVFILHRQYRKWENLYSFDSLCARVCVCHGVMYVMAWATERKKNINRKKIDREEKKLTFVCLGVSLQKQLNWKCCPVFRHDLFSNWKSHSCYTYVHYFRFLCHVHRSTIHPNSPSPSAAIIKT